jgi:hypothetical protein
LSLYNGNEEIGQDLEGYDDAYNYDDASPWGDDDNDLPPGATASPWGDDANDDYNYYDPTPPPASPWGDEGDDANEDENGNGEIVQDLRGDDVAYWGDDADEEDGHYDGEENWLNTLMFGGF